MLSIRENQHKFYRTVLAGLIGTILMTFAIVLLTFFLFIHPFSPPLLLSKILDSSILIGWFVYFMIGVMFAFSYAVLLMPVLKRLSNCYVRGFIFGILLTIMSGLIYYYLGVLNHATWSLVVVLFLSHAVYGIGVARIVVD